MVKDRLGVLTLVVCFRAVFFGVQLILNRFILRDANGGVLEDSVNTRLCVRSRGSLLCIPLALVVIHLLALGLIFVA